MVVQYRHAWEVLITTYGQVTGPWTRFKTMTTIVEKAFLDYGYFGTCVNTSDVTAVAEMPGPGSSMYTIMAVKPSSLT